MTAKTGMRTAGTYQYIDVTAEWELTNDQTHGLGGGEGDDTLEASVSGTGQAHLFGWEGDDTFILDLTNNSGSQGHHVYGGEGSDTFHFTNVKLVNSPVVGRINDFEPTRDVIQIEGQVIDLSALPVQLLLPDNSMVTVRIVQYTTTGTSNSAAALGLDPQQFLQIGDNVIYALDGARNGGLEQHFFQVPDPADLTEVSYHNEINFVPYEHYDDLNLFIRNVVHNDDGFTGWPGAEYIRGNVAGSEDGVASGAHEVIYANESSDVVDGATGDDLIYGGLGNDSIAGGLENDTLLGEDGDDFLWGGSGNDELDGGIGDDQLSGGGQSDILLGRAGKDNLNGDGGNDSLHGHAGYDTIYGGEGEDSVWGGNGRDVIYLGDGNDVFYDNAQNDTHGHDLVFGGTGRDTLLGGGGNDTLGGGGWKDSIEGGIGDDILTGGADDDVLTGGAGSDQFVFQTGADFGNDTITDFTDGVDLIKMNGVTFVDLVIASVGNDVLVSWTDGSVSLSNTLLAEIEQTDFLFG